MRGRVSREQLAFSFDEPTTAAPPYTVVCDDVLRWAETYTGPKFHALLTDAPYHLTSVEKRFGRSSLANETFVNGNQKAHGMARFAKSQSGFMGTRWDGVGEDGQGVAFKPETWKALAQHLLPGAFIMAFASSRGWHRLACAMEDAGLRIYPSIFGWLTAQSFPKASRIDTQVDAQAGAVRESVVNPRWLERYPNGPGGGDPSPMVRQAARKHDGPLTDSLPATPLAQIWAGHRYGGQMLKNSLEPIIVAQVPYAGKPVESIVKHGSGTMWIDGGRISTSDQLSTGCYGGQHRRRADYTSTDTATGAVLYAGLSNGVDPALRPLTTGRWPPNFVLQHVSLPVCRLKGHLPPDTQDAITRYYAGYTEVTALRAGRNGAVHHGLEVLARDIPDGWLDYFELTGEDLGCVAQGTRQVRGSGWTDTDQRTKAEGYRWASDGREEGTQHYADANGMETVPAWACHESCVVRKLDQQAGARGGKWGKQGTEGATSQIGFAMKAKAQTSEAYIGDTGNASRFFHVSSWSLDVAERLAQADPAFYCAKASRGERNRGLEHMPATKSSDDGYGTIQRPILERATPREHWTPHQTANNHPCVKPIALCKWLATLLLPPAAYAPRRLLNVFSGSGSEGIGAMLAGWEEIVMVDQDQSYVDIAEQRLTYWSAHRGATL